MAERPTSTEFAALLDAYAGAVSHVSWTFDNGTPDEQDVAVRAAEEARAKVIAAAMAPCPSCGMELK